MAISRDANLPQFGEGDGRCGDIVPQHTCQLKSASAAVHAVTPILPGDLPMRCLMTIAKTCLLFASVASGLAAEADPAAPRFFVAPITTDVQRAIVSRQADVYAVVDCTALLTDGEFNPEAALLARFEAELQRFAKADADHLALTLRYTIPSNAAIGSKEAIKEKLTSLARSVGFQKVAVSETSTSESWAEAWKPLNDFREPKGVREPFVQTALIKAYPLRTRLSKFLLGSADCVVEIKRPFDGRQRDLSEPLRQSIVEAVRSLEPDQRGGKMLFRVSSTTGGEQQVEKLFDSRPRPTVPPEITDARLRAVLEQRAAEYHPSPAMELANGLGFEQIAYSHSPGGGAPEKLIGQAAPDFALNSLQDETLKLSEFRGGKPALITFWGVACGPCCQEAPHLTRMHAEYGDRLAIVAVNGYDETRETVAAYAKQAALGHPIVLGGSDVANKKYFVGAYPTTYWVSADGVVQDYDVGFESAEVLEERIKQLLGR